MVSRTGDSAPRRAAEAPADESAGYVHKAGSSRLGTQGIGRTVFISDAHGAAPFRVLRDRGLPIHRQVTGEGALTLEIANSASNWRSCSRRRALALLAGTGLASLLTACGTATAVSAPTAGQSATAAGTAATSATGAASTASATSSSAATAASSAPAARTSNLTVLGFGTPDEQAALGKGIQQFMAAHPGMQVDLANPANSNNKLDTLIAAGTPPSTFTLSPFDMPGYVAKGAISPIDAYVAASHYDLTDFYPKALNQYYWVTPHLGEECPTL